MDYRDYLVKKNYSKNTIDAYLKDLELFEDFLDFENIVSVEEKDIIKYLIFLKKDGYSENTILRKIISLKHYYYYAINMGLVSKDPTFNIESPKYSPDFKKEVLSEGDLEILLNYPLQKGKTLKTLRDKLMFELILLTSFKLNDILDKKIIDLNLDIGYLKHKGKYIMLTEDLLIIAKEYRNLVLDKFPSNKNLFVNLRGGPLTRQGAWKIFDSYSKELGIDLSPQILINTSKQL